MIEKISVNYENFWNKIYQKEKSKKQNCVSKLQHLLLCKKGFDAKIDFCKATHQQAKSPDAKMVTP